MHQVVLNPRKTNSHRHRAHPLASLPSFLSVVLSEEFGLALSCTGAGKSIFCFDQIDWKWYQRWRAFGEYSMVLFFIILFGHLTQTGPLK